jgi:hypothetical protein
MGGKKEFLSNLFEYAESEVFKTWMRDYCKERGMLYNDAFAEGGQAGFILAMSMHFYSKNKKTNVFLKKWIKEMAAADHRKRESN